MWTRNKITLTIMFGLLTTLFGCSESKKTELILTEENHNPYYLKGTELIKPFMNLEETSITIYKKAKDSILEGIRYLDAVSKINPNNFAAYWVKGKGYQSLKQHDSAYFQFDKSFQIKKDNSDLARELMIECLYLGKGKEAVDVSLYALSLDSSNAGLIGNLALSYLIKGERELADKTIKRAILAEPSDIINLKLEQIINDVIIGKRKRPTKYDEIQF
jgi:tetratricopeptide (TPR) repeat protein